MSKLASTLDNLGIGQTRSRAKTGGAVRGKQPCNGAPLTLLPVPTFDPDLLPNALRPWVRDIADRMQCPLDFPAVGAMIVLAAVVGRKVGIRPKCRDDWAVTPNLWGGMVARPGFLKSPALREVMRPLKRLEARAAVEHAEALRQYNANAMVGAARKKLGQVEIEKAVKRGGDDPHKLAADLLDETEANPTRRRFLVNDPTPEKLGVILGENPNGVLLERDELTGFLRSLDKPGREDARAFFLECWAGDGRFTVDRIGRGTLDIPACCVSIIGTVQPGPLQSYIFQTLAGGAGDDGLLPRFQMLVWPDPSPEWRNVDRWPDKPAKQRACEVFEQLANLDPFTVGSEQDGEEGMPYLRFDCSAQVGFDEWRGDLERTLRAGTLAQTLEAVLAKHRSLIPSIALLIHLADGGRGPVPLSALDKAVGWGRYLFGHAQRIYSTSEMSDGENHEALLDSIRRLGGRVTARDLRHHGFSGNAEAAQAALERLVKAGAGTWQNVPPGPRGGRPTCVFALTATNTETETPSKREENIGFGSGADSQSDPNTLLQEAADGEEVYHDEAF